ncbi:MAG: hypothetical protein M1822_008729 [Bathelium mastoideum]|nr:MAG: hypothetical protein M1822_008729 [Bathelium mastoideum]
MYTSKYAPAPSTETPPAPSAPSNLLSSSDSSQPADPSFAQSQAEDDLFNDDVTYVEEFAQTRTPDDLFDDDFTPVTPEPSTQQTVPPPTSIPTGPRRRGNDPAPRGSRGRGRGGPETRAPAKRVQQQQPSPVSNTADGSAPTSPATTQDRPSSVRGDRTLTGGIQKPKLSEEELTQRMQQISLKNSTLLAAHERAEADAASFAEREARNAVQAAHRRRADRVNRQQMMGERERNRQRKLDALGGREWDMEKKEEDYSGRDSVRGSANRRGMHGGVGGVSRSQQNGDNQNQQDMEAGGESFRGRGRGGRGRYGSRRGGTQQGRANRVSEQTIPTDADFPELPPGVKPADSGPASKLSLLGKSKDNSESQQQPIPSDGEITQTNKEQAQSNGTTSNAEATKADPGNVSTKEKQLKSPTEGQRSWADQVEAAGP